jgi:hypothetical protein
VTERHITQKQSVRKDETRRAFSGCASAGEAERKNGGKPAKNPPFY